jgi:hypothetical protein
MHYEGEVVVNAITPHVMSDDFFALIQMLYENICKVTYHVEHRLQYLVFYFPSYVKCTIVNRRSILEHMLKLISSHRLYLPLGQKYRVEDFYIVGKHVVYTNIGNMVCITDMPIPNRVPLILLQKKSTFKALQLGSTEMFEKLFQKQAYIFLQNLFVLSSTSDVQCQFNCKILSPHVADHVICQQLNLLFF